MSKFHVTTLRGFNLYVVPAMSETEAELKVNRLADVLGISDSVESVVESDVRTDSYDYDGINWDDAMAETPELSLLFDGD